MGHKQPKAIVCNTSLSRPEVYLLSRHVRLTYQEIADKLGISKESVKTHVKLASGSIAGFIKSHIANIIIVAATLLKKN